MDAIVFRGRYEANVLIGSLTDGDVRRGSDQRNVTIDSFQFTEIIQENPKVY